MNIKALISIDVPYKDRVYSLVVPLGSPYIDIYEVIPLLNDAVKELEKLGIEQAEAAKAQQAAVPIDASVEPTEASATSEAQEA